MTPSVELLGAVLSIVLIDIVLSGDNAVVIGMASRRLPPKQRRLAVILGGGGAVGLRITFTALAAVLLWIPLLQAAGGAMLAWIALKLLRDDHEVEPSSGGHRVTAAASLPGAIRTIVLADVIMSLDNILAVGGAAHGNLALLLFGLALSMPIVLFGSTLIAWVMNRLPQLAYLGSAVLAWTAGDMVLHDRVINQYLPHHQVVEVGVPLALVAGVLLLAFWLRRARRSTLGVPA